MKRIRGLVATLLLGIILTVGTTGAFAKMTTAKTEKQGSLQITSTYYNPAIEYNFQNLSNTAQASIIKPNTISPNYVAFTGDQYEYSTKSIYKAKSWGTVITNNSSTVDRNSIQTNFCYWNHRNIC